MRELHGVIYYGGHWPIRSLKSRSLLFDKFYLISVVSAPVLTDLEEIADFTFLESRGLISQKLDEQEGLPGWSLFEQMLPILGGASKSEIEDFLCRVNAANAKTDTFDTVAICKAPLPFSLNASSNSKAPNLETALRVALEAFPVPDETCSWEDILDFKSEMRDKQWDFRRFLRTLALKQQGEAEIRDDIEWTINEYSKAMNLHHLKSSQSFVDVFLVSPLEIIENLVKLNFSKVLKGALSIKKREVELLEAEMKASGRECAYVFDARKKFRS